MHYFGQDKRGLAALTRKVKSKEKAFDCTT